MFRVQVNGGANLTLDGTFEQVERLVENLMCSDRVRSVDVWVDGQGTWTHLGTLENIVLRAEAPSHESAYGHETPVAAVAAAEASSAPLPSRPAARTPAGCARAPRRSERRLADAREPSLAIP